jgi:lipopolysaccharide transport system permease protein
MHMIIGQGTLSRLRVFLNYRELFFQLVSRDIKLKYRRSVLGYFWSVLNPLLSMIVMTIVFSSLFARGIQHFPVYLLIGNALFSFMTGAVSRALPSVLGNASLFKKIYVPKYIFTLAAVSSEFVTLLFSLGALVVVIAATRTPVTARFLLVLIPTVEQYVFCVGLGLFMAQATVFFRDVQHIWGVFSMAWMYLSAIFYPVTILPDWLRLAVTRYNPMYFYITLFRNFTIGSANSGSLDLTIRGAVAAGLMLLIGLVTFSRSKNKFILYM